MSDVIIKSYFDIDLIQCDGSDEMICKAARVSTLGSASIDSTESEGLINYLMRNRHGSPFEHGFFTFRIHAPIFVWREFMRHRIGFSYNEESGRYKKLEPVFYIPPEDRELVQVGKPGAYSFVPGDEDQYKLMYDKLYVSYVMAWDHYEDQLEAGIAKEVARMCLPVSIFSAAYVSCNPRSMMSFLSLRTKHDAAQFVSTPMKEINQVADRMEELFAAGYPLTAKAFTANGRVSP